MTRQERREYLILELIKENSNYKVLKTKEE